MTEKTAVSADDQLAEVDDSQTAEDAFEQAFAAEASRRDAGGSAPPPELNDDDEEAAERAAAASDSDADGSAEQTAAQPEGQAADDIDWSTVPEPVRDRMASLEADLHQWQHNARSQAGRQSHLAKKLNAVQKELEELRSQTSSSSQAGNGDANDSSAAGLTDEELSDLAEDYPQAAKALKALQAQVSRQAQPKPETKTQTDSPRADDQPPAEPSPEQVKAENDQIRELTRQHPDWRDYQRGGRRREAFDAWLNTQPLELARKIGSNSAADAADLISRFKNRGSDAQPGQSSANASTTTRSERRQQRLAGAVAAPSRASSARPEPEADDFHSAFARFAAAKDQTAHS